MLQLSQRSQLSKILISLLFFVVIFLMQSCAKPNRAISPERIEMAKSKFMARWDINQDNEITCADSQLKQQNKFNNTDLDKSNSLEVNEFKQAPWSNPAFAQEHHQLFDLNNDGKISWTEFETRPDDQFIRMDKNQDCKISMKEMAQVLSERKPQRMGGNGKRGNRGKGKKQRLNYSSGVV